MSLAQKKRFNQSVLPVVISAGLISAVDVQPAANSKPSMLTRGLVGASAFASATFANATAIIDPLVFDPQITDITTDITTVGTALIGLAIVAMGIKWVKASFF